MACPQHGWFPDEHPPNPGSPNDTRWRCAFFAHHAGAVSTLVLALGSAEIHVLAGCRSFAVPRVVQFVIANSLRNIMRTFWGCRLETNQTKANDSFALCDDW